MGRFLFWTSVSLALCGCTTAGRTPAAASNAATVTLVDDTGDTLRLTAPAHRIMSLIPSGTESLVALGGIDLIVARTRYDTDSAVAAKPSVGGGLDPDLEQIVALRPDVVVVQSGDKRGDIRRKLADVHIPTFALALQDTADALRAIDRLGRIIGHDSIAVALASSLRTQLHDVAVSVAGAPRPKVFFVVFNNPPMTAGPATFIGQMIGVAGGTNIFADVTQNWPTVTMEELIRRDPDVVVLPTGEFKTNTLASLRQQAGWKELRAVRDGHVVTVSANLVTRPGPHLGDAARSLRDVLHAPTTAAH